VEHGPKYQAWVKSLGRQGRACLALESCLRERLPAMCHSHSGVSGCELCPRRLLPLLLWARGLSGQFDGHAVGECFWSHPLQAQPLLDQRCCQPKTG
jgi:hypothetical protein